MRVGAFRDGAVPHTLVPVEEMAPITRLRSFGQVSFAERLDAIVGNVVRDTGVPHERLQFGGQIAEVALDFDVVLVRSLGCKEIMMVLYVL
jgi:hypothetical protein